jgi:hypothetical protein
MLIRVVVLLIYVQGGVERDGWSGTGSGSGSGSPGLSTYVEYVVYKCVFNLCNHLHNTCAVANTCSVSSSEEGLPENEVCGSSKL